jgi:hypothetical protein
MWDELRVFGVVTIMLATLTALIVMMIQPLAAKSCREDWAGSAYQARYGFWTDCQILTDRGWVPASSYRTTDKP